MHTPARLFISLYRSLCLCELKGKNLAPGISTAVRWRRGELSCALGAGFFPSHIPTWSGAEREAPLSFTALRKGPFMKTHAHTHSAGVRLTSVPTRRCARKSLFHEGSGVPPRWSPTHMKKKHDPPYTSSQSATASCYQIFVAKNTGLRRVASQRPRRVDHACRPLLSLLRSGRALG